MANLTLIYGMRMLPEGEVSEIQDATLKLANGKTFTISTKGNGWQEYYIRSATLNDETLDKSYFSHQDVLKGGELAFTMGPQANKKWGAAPENRPPSALAQLSATTPGK